MCLADVCTHHNSPNSPVRGLRGDSKCASPPSLHPPNPGPYRGKGDISRSGNTFFTYPDGDGIDFFVIRTRGSFSVVRGAFLRWEKHTHIHFPRSHPTSYIFPGKLHSGRFAGFHQGTAEGKLGGKGGRARKRVLIWGGGIGGWKDQHKKGGGQAGTFPSTRIMKPAFVVSRSLRVLSGVFFCGGRGGGKIFWFGDFSLESHVFVFLLGSKLSDSM